MKLLWKLWPLLLFHCAMAQSDRGLPFITNFPTSVYRQGPQNFTILQSKEGLLYVGNNNGLMVYDGVDWRLITVSNKSEVHSLAQDDQGTLYVGAQGDFGYLKKNNAGDLVYASLLHLLDSTHRNFNDVWSIHITQDQVVFRSTKGLYIYNKQSKTIKAIPFNTTRHRSFLVNNQVWVRLEGTGLLRLQNDSLFILPNGESLQNESLNALFPYGNKQVLLISEKRGLIVYDGENFTPLENPVNSLLIGQNSFGKLLNNGSYAIGTRTNGLLILDKNGKLQQRLGKKQGLLDESVWSIEEDQFTHNLWVACNNGISLIEAGSPFTSFQERTSVNGQFYYLGKHANTLYATSSVGLYKKEMKSPDTDVDFNTFSLLGEAGLQTWHLYCDDEIALITSNIGIFSIENDQLQNIGFRERAWYLQPLSKFPGYILANTVEGLILLKREGKHVRVHRKLGNSPESIYYFAEDQHGAVWINSPTRGIYRVRFLAGMDADPELTLFTDREGLPSTYRVRPFQLQTEVVFGTEKGLYRFNDQTEKFEWHASLNYKLFGAEKRWVDLLRQDKYGNLWGTYVMMKQDKRYAIGFFAKASGNNFEVQDDIFRRINNLKINDIHVLDQDNIYLLSSDGIVHYRPLEKIHKEVPVLIRSIEAIQQDSSIRVQEFDKVPASFNNLRFHFAGMGFTSPGEMEYSYLLENFDKQWSPFTSLPQKEYTNLPAGIYIFKIRARSLQNVLSEENALSFTIKKPWHQSIWAYAIYILAFSLSILGLVRWRSNNLRQANQQLEKSIQERTQEIKKQNQDILEKNELLEAQKEEIEASREEIEEANRVIAQQNENLKYINSNLEKIVESRTGELQHAYTNLLAIKQELDTFIYRSSHDIKGPLTRLLGLCHIAKLDIQDKNALQYIHLLENEINATNRILQKLLVYQSVKDWTVKNELVSMHELVNKILSQLQNLPNFSATTIKHNQEVNCHIATDQYLLDVVLHNVIENAILFSDSMQPAIGIACKKNDNYLNIYVSDNGRGIEASIADNIFSMFYRGNEKSKGAGLGLFIAKEALAKLGGTIQIKSAEGWSTTFEISLPYTAK